MFYNFFCLLLIFKFFSITEEQIEEFEKEYTPKIFKFDKNLRNKIISCKNDNNTIEFTDEEIQILLINGLPLFPREIKMLKSIARSFIFSGAFDRVFSNILYSIKVELLEKKLINIFKELEIDFFQKDKNPECVESEINRIKSDLKRFNKIDNQKTFAEKIKKIVYSIANTLERQNKNYQITVKLKNKLKRILEKIQIDIEEIIWKKVCYLEDLFFEATKNDFEEIRIFQIGQIIQKLQNIALEKDKYKLSSNLHSLCFGLENLFVFFLKLSESCMIKIVFENHESLILCQINEENEIESVSESQDGNEISEYNSNKCPVDFLSLSEKKMLLIIKAEQIKNFMFLGYYNLGFFFLSMSVEHFSEKNHFFFKHINIIVFNIEKCISFDNSCMPQTQEDSKNKNFHYNINQKSSRQVNNFLNNFERFIKSNTENVNKEFYIQIDDYICFYNGNKFLPMKNFKLKNQVRFAYLRYYLHSTYFNARTLNLIEFINIKEINILYDLLTPAYRTEPYKLVDIDSSKENFNNQFIYGCSGLKEKIDNKNKIPFEFLECFQLQMELDDLSNLHLDNLILFGQYKKIEIQSQKGKISGSIIEDFIYFSLTKNSDYNFSFIKNLPYISELAKRGYSEKYLLITGTFDIDICFYDAFLVKSKSNNEKFYIKYSRRLLYCRSMIIEPYQFKNICISEIKLRSCVLNKNQYSEDEVVCLICEIDLILKSCEINIPLRFSNLLGLYIRDCKFKKDIFLIFSPKKSYNFHFINSEFKMDFNGFKIQSFKSTEVDEIELPHIFFEYKEFKIYNSKCNGSLIHNKSNFECIEFYRCNISFNMVLDLKVISFLKIHKCIGKLFFILNDHEFGNIEFKNDSIFKIEKIYDNYYFKFLNIDFKKKNEYFFKKNRNCILRRLYIL